MNLPFITMPLLSVIVRFWPLWLTVSAVTSLPVVVMVVVVAVEPEFSS